MRYELLSGRFAVAQSTIVPIKVPYSLSVTGLLKIYMFTHKGRKELEASKEQTPVFSNTAFLDIKLGEAHEVPIGEAYCQPSDVERNDVLCGHHDDVRDAADDTCESQALPTSELVGSNPCEARANKGA
jgi:hypothetical protein